MGSVERAMAKAAAALLPGLLPTPPRSTIVPCVVTLPSSFACKPKPGRADSVDRWDAHKKDKKPGSPASSCGSSSSGRASSCERWDMNKKSGSSSSKSSSSSSSSSRGSSGIPGRASWSERWDSSKRPPSHASSADHWDTHKKPRPLQVDDAESRTDEQEERDINDDYEAQEDKMMVDVFSGSSFFASPEPSMLPMPTFFLRSRGPDMNMMPVQAILRAH